MVLVSSLGIHNTKVSRVLYVIFIKEFGCKTILGRPMGYVIMITNKEMLKGCSQVESYEIKPLSMSLLTIGIIAYVLDFMLLAWICL